jgi:hypothetical protein
MIDWLPAPWYDRHKGKLAGVGLLGTVAGILGVIFRADLRPILAIAAHGLVNWLQLTWRWLWASHGTAGWVLLLLGFACLPALRLLVRVMTGRSGTIRLGVDLEQVNWEIWLSPEGKVLGTPVPFCPQCQCQIAPTYRQDAARSRVVTSFRCEDCQGINLDSPNHPTVVFDRIARRVEAQWRRGELRHAQKGSWLRPAPPTEPPFVAARLEQP